MDERDVAWSAGLFEGEGWITTNGRRRWRWRLGIASCDQDIINRFAVVVGGHFYNYGMEHLSGNAKKPQHRLLIVHSEDVERVLLLFWNYLGQRRRKRAHEALASLQEEVSKWISD